MITYSLVVRSDGQDQRLFVFPAVKITRLSLPFSLILLFRIHCFGKLNDRDLRASSWGGCVEVYGTLRRLYVLFYGLFTTMKVEEIFPARALHRCALI